MQTGKKLEILICGKTKNLGEISEVFCHLGFTIAFFGDKAASYIGGNIKDDLTELGPFCGRRLLESGCTVFLGRIDPFRLLLVKRFQSQPNYNIGVRGKLSVQWSGDILAQKVSQELWGQNVESKDVSRALFSQYSHQIYWENAFVRMQDELKTYNSIWLNELLCIQPEGITNHFRTEGDKLFSSLSKGVHTEFVVSSAVVYDTATVTTLLENTISYLSKVAMVANYIPTSLVKLPGKQLIKHILQIERELK